MDLKEHLFQILSEECVETSQVVSKILRFGVYDHAPGQEKSNEDRLIEEYHQIIAAMEMLQERKLIRFVSEDHKRMIIESKKIAVSKYLAYSKQHGTLKE